MCISSFFSANSSPALALDFVYLFIYLFSESVLGKSSLEYQLNKMTAIM